MGSYSTPLHTLELDFCNDATTPHIPDLAKFLSATTTTHLKVLRLTDFFVSLDAMRYMEHTKHCCSSHSKLTLSDCTLTNDTVAIFSLYIRETSNLQELCWENYDQRSQQMFEYGTFFATMFTDLTVTAASSNKLRRRGSLQTLAIDTEFVVMVVKALVVSNSQLRCLRIGRGVSRHFDQPPISNLLPCLPRLVGSFLESLRCNGSLHAVSIKNSRYRHDGEEEVPFWTVLQRRQVNAFCLRNEKRPMLLFECLFGGGDDDSVSNDRMAITVEV